MSDQVLSESELVKAYDHILNAIEAAIKSSESKEKKEQLRKLQVALKGLLDGYYFQTEPKNITRMNDIANLKNEKSQSIMMSSIIYSIVEESKEEEKIKLVNNPSVQNQIINSRNTQYNNETERTRQQFQSSLKLIFKQTLRITTHTDLAPRFLGFGKNTKSYKAAKDNLNLAKNTLKIKEQDWKSVIYGFSDDMKKLGIETFKKAENKMALFEKSLSTSIEKTQTQKIENTNYFYREFCSFFKTSESNNAPKV
ncbi:hypothetical protein L3V79_07140 [Thiotrichales bacterium 19S9-12]|nr:hypothetical protein [Thiotrichales bacterium 19S9-11]MCF6812129.1 hypothetical protein [Thiotrichales bacterium 19S9-12]